MGQLTQSFGSMSSFETKEGGPKKSLTALNKYTLVDGGLRDPFGVIVLTPAKATLREIIRAVEDLLVDGGEATIDEWVRVFTKK